jgi:electron transfer flavoprotein beta subunit
VGAILAALLDIPQMTVATKVDVEGNTIKVVRPVEGAELVIESSLPCVVTAHKGLNVPRFASLPGIMKARNKPVEVRDAAALGVSMNAKAEIFRMMPPSARLPGRIISGDDPADKAKELTKMLREEAKAI